MHENREGCPRLDQFPRPAQSPAPVKLALTLFLALCLAPLSADAQSKAKTKRRYVLYASFLEDTGVKLADGAEWMMDKGDSFPVLMFKEMQTKVVLQLAGTTFWTDASRVRVVPEREVTPAMIASYRRNVSSYIDGRAKRWQAEVKGEVSE